MKIKNLIYFVPFLITPFSLKAQYASDGLKFSQPALNGNARYLSIGGAQGSLGGDLGSLSGNPAGVGMFRKSDISFSLQYNNNSAEGSYLNSPSQKESANNFKLSNFSAAFPIYINRSKVNEISNEWVGVVFGVGYNRTNDFYANFNFNGRNANNSITQSYAQEASAIGTTNDLLPSRLGYAYDNYLIDEEANDPVTGKVLYTPISTGNVDQWINNKYDGSQSETNVSLATNYGNKLYLGGSLTFTNQKYNMEGFFRESGIQSIFQNPNTSVVSMDEKQNLSVKGTGFSGKLGAIYRPVDELRLGGTIYFPTSWNMQEDYVYDLNSTAKDGTVRRPSQLDPSYFEYTLTTPFKFNIGASYFIGKSAFISADVDFIDYSSMKLSSNDIDLDNNFKTEVRQNYRSAINVHLGGEVKFDQLSVRAGFAQYGNPFSENSVNDGKRNYYTSGIGYRINNFYVDAAYVNSSFNTTYRPYLLDDFSEPVINIKQRTNSVVLTVGTRF
ncbi:OmpP1/FadL family transporter [Solitalea canadensis]|uniref:Long-chain fatty acid transport protein n=1 Tax=Solitalea canadensis (strain ATCC 29591 / DSM 3403 / JCM 21819 / LMG 8368 / NBRC 15130 / NCIMB 12057 / USAM 9D) TaxID=929556 RepID=H8KW44_SOLCM|nr:hypothetical protein [Solitalea canadensis]AFD07065.1 hypothetical protein Solca_2010 [Solitalea canadensis DSM 3403]